VGLPPRQLRRAPLVLLGIVVALAVTGGGAATTQPGMLFVTRLALTDHAILVRGDKFLTRAGVPAYPRETEVWGRRGTFTFRAQPNGPRVRMRVD
jgi:hypothetical protein